MFQPSAPKLVVVVFAALSAWLAVEQSHDTRRQLVIVVDGLRPDYVTPTVMPHLTALGKRGVVFTHHHSVFPTVTRVNGASIATGTYPERHRLLGNSVFFPRVDRAKFLDTANRADLKQIEQVEGRLLTASTIGELLEATGRRMLVISSGSAGSAILNNPTVAGGPILHQQFTMPESFAPSMADAGPPPPPNAAPGSRDRYAVDVFLKVGLPRVDPTVTILWLGELDATAHDNGLGAPETVAVLRRVDGEIKRVEDGLNAAGLLTNFDIWVASDHGFSTHDRGPDVGSVLSPFKRALADGSPAVVQGGGAIYVRDGNDGTISGIVAALQRTPGVGAIFTPAAGPGSFDGTLPGTLSFDAIRWTHERSAQILFSSDWSDAANGHDIKGTAASSGTAGHGSSSPWDVHNTLIAAGPDLRRGITIAAPSANVDLAPTLLKLLGVAAASLTQGRPLNEALVNGEPLSTDAVHELKHTVTTPDGGYALTAAFSTVSVGKATYRYFDQTIVTRR
jgi:predicted AlkP superfamily pyrophosphatase or phosphodiesterase